MDAFEDICFDEQGDIDLEAISKEYNRGRQDLAIFIAAISQESGRPVDRSNLHVALKGIYNKGVDHSIQFVSDELIRYCEGGGDLRVLVLLEECGFVDTGDVIRRLTRRRMIRYTVLVMIWLLLTLAIVFL